MLLLNTYLLAGTIYLIVANDDVNFIAAKGKTAVLWDTDPDKDAEEVKDYMFKKYKYISLAIFIQLIFLPLIFLYVAIAIFIDLNKK